MQRDDARIEAVLSELADLGRRIGQRAGELARLTATTYRSPGASNADSTQSLAAAAAELAAGAATVVAVSAGAENGAANRDTATPRQPITQSEPQTRGTTLASQRHESRSNAVKQPSTDIRKSAAKVADRRGRPAGPGPLPKKATRISRSRPLATHRAIDGVCDSRRWRQAFGPMVTSSVIHAVAIIVFAMTFIAGVKTEQLAITLEIGAESATEELSPIAIEASDPLAADPFPSGENELAEPLSELDAVAEMANHAVEPAMPEVEPTAVLPAAWSAPTSLESADLGGMLSEIGMGAGTRAGGARGGGNAGGATGRGDTTFFGRNGEGRSVCFLCDNSNSHSNGGFHVVLEEVARAVDALPEDQSFFVVFFSDAAYPLFHPEPADALVPATPANKRRLRSWLGTVEMCQGGQGIHEAVKTAGTIGPDTVYLLSDGEFTASVVDRVVAAEFGDAVVHTFGIQQSAIDRRTGQVDPDRLLEQQGYNHNLLTIATAHGGGFTPVNIPPAASALERARPIPKNRSRGAVWGLKL